MVTIQKILVQYSPDGSLDVTAVQGGIAFRIPAISGNIWFKPNIPREFTPEQVDQLQSLYPLEWKYNLLSVVSGQYDFTDLGALSLSAAENVLSYNSDVEKLEAFAASVTDESLQAVLFNRIDELKARLNKIQKPPVDPLSVDLSKWEVDDAIAFIKSQDDAKVLNRFSSQPLVASVQQALNSRISQVNGGKGSK